MEKIALSEFEISIITDALVDYYKLQAKAYHEASNAFTPEDFNMPNIEKTISRFETLGA